LTSTDEATVVREAARRYDKPLKPVLVNKFRRITFAGFDTPEGITLDLDLYYNLLNGKSIGPYG
jgi:hypothetical protein